MAEMAKSKESFFKGLEDLDKVSGSSGESSGILGKALRTAEKPGNIAPSLCRPSVTDNVKPRSLSRTPSAPQPRIQRADSDEVIVVKETPYPKQSDHGVVKRLLPPGKVGGKRKRGAGSVKIIPEAQQIFKGFSFCRSVFRVSMEMLLSFPTTQSLFQTMIFLRLADCESKDAKSMELRGPNNGACIFPMSSLKRIWISKMFSNF